MRRHATPSMNRPKSRSVVCLQQRWWGGPLRPTVNPAACMKRPGAASVSALKRVDQRDRASVEPIEGGLEYLGRLIPRVRDAATFLEPWIEITGDDNPRGIHAKTDGNLACLICIHNNDEICAADCVRGERPR